MKAFRTISSRLFICYTSIIILALFVFTILFYSYTADILEKRASESLQQLSINTNQNLDSLIKNMDMTASRIVSSALIKDSFYEKTYTPSENLENKHNLMQLLFTVTGYSMESNISISGLNGKLVEYGGKTFDVSQQSPELLLDTPWINECFELDGKTYVTYPRVYEFGNANTRVFSVCRAFNETFGAKYNAVVEVLKSYDVLSNTIEAAINPSNSSKATVTPYIYDNKGQQVYPFPENKITFSYYEQISKLKNDFGTLTGVQGSENQILAYARSNYSGWTMVVCENETQLLTPVVKFRNQLIIVSIITVILTMIITFFLSRQLTQPIRNIQKSISQLDLSDLHSQEISSKSSAYELTKLNNAYIKMVDRLQVSLDETVKAHSNEVESRMLALQAQMNPHFLYNAITIISIKAENSGDDAVVQMCESLSSMLRYIAKETPSTVTMADELNHLSQYLFLMECRYQEKFTVDINIPENMQYLQIPKLIIQPLVENCFKHGFTTREQWHISIKGEIIDNIWLVSVSDNGIGFSVETLKKLQEIFALSQGDFKETERDNIGLGNIFHRLKYQYNKYATFNIENLPDKGCIITIGGKINIINSVTK